MQLVPQTLRMKCTNRKKTEGTLAATYLKIDEEKKHSPLFIGVLYCLAKVFYVNLLEMYCI